MYQNITAMYQSIIVNNNVKQIQLPRYAHTLRGGRMSLLARALRLAHDHIR